MIRPREGGIYNTWKWKEIKRKEGGRFLAPNVSLGFASDLGSNLGSDFVQVRLWKDKNDQNPLTPYTLPPTPHHPTPTPFSLQVPSLSLSASTFFNPLKQSFLLLHYTKKNLKFSLSLSSYFIESKNKTQISSGFFNWVLS